MMRRVLGDGRAVAVAHAADRVGTGPWARWLASAVVPDEASPRAERGRRLAHAGAVGHVVIEAGSITARVTGSTGNDYSVTISVPTVPEAVWDATLRAARGNRELEAGASGLTQSIHLAHLMTTRLGASLAPRPPEVDRRCTCPDAEWSGACKHVAATAFVVADEIDRDPSLLLIWRGCRPLEQRHADVDPWEAGPLPPLRAARPLPPGAVLKRLGRSGIRVGGVDLTDALAPAYEAFTATRPDTA